MLESLSQPVLSGLQLCGDDSDPGSQPSTQTGSHNNDVLPHPIRKPLSGISIVVTSLLSVTQPHAIIIPAAIRNMELSVE